MKIAIAKFGQETSSFSPVATTVDTFREFGIFEGAEILERYDGLGSIGGFLEGTQEVKINWTPVALFSAWAGASGIISDETLQFFEDKLRRTLQANNAASK